MPDPHIVTQAPFPPGQCLFSQDIDGPWIDLGVVAPWIRPHGYLSVKYVEGLARDVLNMIPEDVVQTQIAELREQLDSYQTKFEKLEAFANATAELEAVA